MLQLNLSLELLNRCVCGQYFPCFKCGQKGARSDYCSTLPQGVQKSVYVCGALVVFTKPLGLNRFGSLKCPELSDQKEYIVVLHCLNINWRREKLQGQRYYIRAEGKNKTSCDLLWSPIIYSHMMWMKLVRETFTASASNILLLSKERPRRTTITN